MISADRLACLMKEPPPPLYRLGEFLDSRWGLRRGSVHDRCMEAILERGEDCDPALLGILAAEDWARRRRE